MSSFDSTLAYTTWTITTLIHESGITYYYRKSSDSSRYNSEWVTSLDQATRFGSKAQLYKVLKNLTAGKNDYFHSVVQVETTVNTTHIATPYDFTQDVDFHTVTLEAAVKKAKALLDPAEFELLGLVNKEVYLKMATHGVDDPAEPT